MNSSLWSENVLNLATFLTSIVSLFTLNELRKQRYLANSPKIHITSKKFVISATNKRISRIEKELPIKWESEFLKEIDHGFPPIYQVPLNLINIGSTPALNVKIAWNYDSRGLENIKNIIKQFNELEIGVKCEVPDNDSLPVTDQLVILRNNLKTTISMELMPLNVEYIFPFSESNSGTEIIIPYPYFLITAFTLSVLSLSENHHDLSVPTLYAEVSYYDNINILHKEKFSVKSNIYELRWEYINGRAGEKKFEFANFTIETNKITGNTYLNIIEKIIKSHYHKNH